jgi:hypothetical protein
MSRTRWSEVLRGLSWKLPVGRAYNSGTMLKVYIEGDLNCIQSSRRATLN